MPGIQLATTSVYSPANSIHGSLQTFGLKNKGKSAKVQAQVKILQQQAAQKGVNNETASEKKREKEALQEKKRREQAKKDELNALFTPLDIVQPKVPFGVGK